MYPRTTIARAPGTRSTIRSRSRPVGQREARRSRAGLAHDGHPGPVEAEEPDEHDRRRQHDERPGKPAGEPPQQPQRRHARQGDDRRRRVGLGQRPPDRGELGQEAAGRQIDLEPQQRRDLLEDGEPDGALDESLQDGIGNDVRDPAELQPGRTPGRARRRGASGGRSGRGGPPPPRRRSGSPTRARPRRRRAPRRRAGSRRRRRRRRAAAAACTGRSPDRRRGSPSRRAPAGRAPPRRRPPPRGRGEPRAPVRRQPLDDRREGAHGGGLRRPVPGAAGKVSTPPIPASRRP